jgi:hypothetical protein
MSAFRLRTSGRRARGRFVLALLAAPVFLSACDESKQARDEQEPERDGSMPTPTCDADADCADDEACRWSTGTSVTGCDCNADGVCCVPDPEPHPAGTGRCERLAARGEACVVTSQCLTGLVCLDVHYDPDGGPSDGHCAAPPALGERCAWDGECQARTGHDTVDDTKFCFVEDVRDEREVGVCARWGSLEVGDHCTLDGECRPGSLCPYTVEPDIDSVCVAIGTTVGSACVPDAGDAACEPGAYCHAPDWPDSGVCRPDSERGAE